MSGLADGGKLMQIKTLSLLVVIAMALFTVWGCDGKGCSAPDSVERLEGRLYVVETPSADAYVKLVREPSTGACWLVIVGSYDGAVAMHASPCPPAEAK